MNHEQAIEYLRANPGKTVEFGTKYQDQTWQFHTAFLDDDGDFVYSHPTEPIGYVSAPEDVSYHVPDPPLTHEALAEIDAAQQVADDREWERMQANGARETW